MTIYGVTSKGFNKKPISQILLEIEGGNVTEFGDEVIQTSQSPLGQINGIQASVAYEEWSALEDVYNSLDPDLAEGARLDIIARLRLISRNGVDDSELRRIITNKDVCNLSLADMVYALKSIDGVSFAKVYENNTGEEQYSISQKGVLSVCIIGGSDDDIAQVLNRYVVPGISTYGNYDIQIETNGTCRNFFIIRPVEVRVVVDVVISSSGDNLCAPPLASAVKEYFVSQWNIENYNGKDVNFSNIRKIVESKFPRVTVDSYSTARGDEEPVAFKDTDMLFTEMSILSSDDVGVRFE